MSQCPRGIKFGLNLSSMYGGARDSVSTAPSAAVAAGAFVVLPLHERFEAQAELLLSVKGVKQDFTGDIFGGAITLSETGYLLYAEIPILFKVPFPSTGVRRTSFFTGPYCAFNLLSLTRGEYDVEGSTALYDGTFSGSIGNVHRLDFGIVVGADHRFLWGGRTVALDLRYTQGLREVFYDLENRSEVPEGDIPYVYSYSDQAREFKNATLSLSLSLLLKP